MALSKLINRGTEESATAKRLELWDALARYIHDRGGFVTSVPGARIIRIEVREGSELPIRLAERGFKLNFVGTETRLGGIAETIEVDIIEIALGK